MGTKFHFMDITSEIEQLNIVEDASADEIANLLIAVLTWMIHLMGQDSFEGKTEKWLVFYLKIFKRARL